jgi:O-antigen/teichoic acid export membrane protein
MAGKLVSLAGARVVAQLLGLGWFLYAARAFGPHDFGVLSTGLVLVVVFGGLSDLGTTRTVVRHVAADHSSLRANFLRALALRAGAGAVLAVIAVALSPLVQHSVAVSVVLTAALIAVASGGTEVGFAALRSVGLVGAEVSLLVSERLLFVIGGSVVVILGYGPVAVLVVYACTNLISAGIVGFRAVTWSGGHGAPAGRMLDAEGRGTAVSSTLVIVGPMISALLLVLLSVPAVVGVFTIAQKIPQALGTLGTAALLPVLAMVRSAIVADRGSRAVERAGRVTAAVTAVAVPAAAWLCVDANRVLQVLFGVTPHLGMVAALRLLAVACVVWIVRTFGELVLLAQERASRYVVAVAVGVGANLLVGVGMVDRWGASGAAGAALIAEVMVAVLVFIALRATVRLAVWRMFAPVVLVGAAAALSVKAVQPLPFVIGMGVAGAWALVGLAVTGRHLRDAAGADGSGPDGHDADVGQEVGGELLGDGIEAIEYVAGPTDHL